jgi:hypothetical protein
MWKSSRFLFTWFHASLYTWFYLEWGRRSSSGNRLGGTPIRCAWIFFNLSGRIFWWSRHLRRYQSSWYKNLCRHSSVTPFAIPQGSFLSSLLIRIDPCFSMPYEGNIGYHEYLSLDLWKCSCCACRCPWEWVNLGTHFQPTDSTGWFW